MSDERTSDPTRVMGDSTSDAHSDCETTYLRIVDYDVGMRDDVRRLFADIYPDRPETADRMCYDPAVSNHVTTKVAFRGEAMVGQANVFLQKALGGNANLGFHVHPSVRKRGIATALSREAIRDARSRGISDLYIRTGTDNVAAMAVARKLGFARDDGRFPETGLAVFVSRP